MKKLCSLSLLFALFIVSLLPVRPVLAEEGEEPQSPDRAQGIYPYYLPFTTHFNAQPPASNNLPYPASQIIEEIRWDFDNLVRLAPGSDLWPVTWGPDDNIYTSWGDGGGFDGSERNGRVSLGFARIEGSADNFRGINIWGGKDAENPAEFEGKAAGIVSIDGVLYAWIDTETGRKLGWSTNLGGKWNLASWEFSKSTFVPFSILNFGKDYAGARDNYVYSYGHEWGGSKNAYLIRALKDQLKDKDAYEFFAGIGSDSHPNWSKDIKQRHPVFTDPSGKDDNMSPTVVYNPGLGRYILTMSRGGPNQLAIFDAPEPWGPWMTVAYYDKWGGYKGVEALLYSFPSKWMSADGKTMWMIFSSTGSLDSFNLVKATLKLR